MKVRKLCAFVLVALSACSSDPPPAQPKPAPPAAPAPPPPAPPPAPAPRAPAESISVKGSSRPRPAAQAPLTDQTKIEDLKRRARETRGQGDAPPEPTPVGPLAPGEKEKPTPPVAKKGGRPATATLGELAPSLTVGPSLDGLMGKVVLVAFWTPGSQAARGLIRRLRGYASSYGDKIAIIAVLEPQQGVDSGPGDDAGEAPWPVAMDTQGETAAKYGVHGGPQVFVTDKKGVLRFMSEPGPQGLQKLIDEE